MCDLSSDINNNRSTTHQRLIFIDIIRQAALFYMFFQHGVLEVLVLRHSSVITLIADFVPICSALFLFAAGFSAVISQKSDIRKNVMSRLRKGIFLIAASSLLFAIECGFRMPDMIFASGILNTIGLFTISTIVLSVIPEQYHILICSIWTVIITILFIAFDIKRIYVFPFTAAYECIVPTVIYGYIGMTAAVIYKQISSKTLMHTFMLAAGAVTLFIMHILFGIHHCFDYTHGRYTIIRSFADGKLMVWNFNTISFIASLAAVMMLCGICGLLEPLWHHLPDELPHKIFMPGQHSLINYFYHLSVWAIIVVTAGFNEMPQNIFLIVLLLLYITSYPVSYAAQLCRQRYANRH